MIPPYNGQSYKENVGIELGISKEFQLYNLNEDIIQQHNLAKEQPLKLKECIAIYQELRGRKNIELK
jgi:hypothetical protein